MYYTTLATLRDLPPFETSTTFMERVPKKPPTVILVPTFQTRSLRLKSDWGQMFRRNGKYTKASHHFASSADSSSWWQQQIRQKWRQLRNISTSTLQTYFYTTIIAKDSRFTIRKSGIKLSSHVNRACSCSSSLVRLSAFVVFTRSQHIIASSGHSWGGCWPARPSARSLVEYLPHLLVVVPMLDNGIIPQQHPKLGMEEKETPFLSTIPTTITHFLRQQAELHKKAQQACRRLWWQLPGRNRVSAERQHFSVSVSKVAMGLIWWGVYILGTQRTIVSIHCCIDVCSSLLWTQWYQSDAVSPLTSSTSTRDWVDSLYQYIC
jgi:hypothetical protein